MRKGSSLGVAMGREGIVGSHSVDRMGWAATSVLSYYAVPGLYEQDSTEDWRADVLTNAGVPKSKRSFLRFFRNRNTRTSGTVPKNSKPAA